MNFEGLIRHHILWLDRDSLVNTAVFTSCWLKLIPTFTRRHSRPQCLQTDVNVSGNRKRQNKTLMCENVTFKFQYWPFMHESQLTSPSIQRLWTYNRRYEAYFSFGDLTAVTHEVWALGINKRWGWRCQVNLGEHSEFVTGQAAEPRGLWPRNTHMTCFTWRRLQSWTFRIAMVGLEH